MGHMLTTNIVFRLRLTLAHMRQLQPNISDTRRNIFLFGDGPERRRHIHLHGRTSAKRDYIEVFSRRKRNDSSCAAVQWQPSS